MGEHKNGTTNGSNTAYPSTTSEEGKGQHKKRRIPGACDICKRKKIRCDSGEMPGNKCSTCIQYGFECTHKEVTKTLGSAKGYVESLEARLEKMDKLLTKLLPGVDLTQEVDKLLEEIDVSDTVLRADDDEPPLVEKVAKLRLDPPQTRFFGKSSGMRLIQTALDLRNHYNGERHVKEPEFLTSRRKQFWEIPPWVSHNPAHEKVQPQYQFPDADLMVSLVDNYFTQINPFLPLLHRPIFQRGINEGLHLKDATFGATVLLVCALGSRYSDDPRVFVKGFDSTRSAGWKWYEQVQVLRTSFFRRTSLHELQAYVLSALFAQSSETPQGCWSQIGMALRLAQEVGAHSRRTKMGNSTAEDELWKRAFWVLVSIDRLTSSFSGRPCGLQDEDFDLDLPIECDDEFWENPDPEQCFKQPSTKPSLMAYFTCYLSLMDILAYAMRVIYSIKRPKNMFIGRVIQRSEQQIIAELDSALNNWMDSVPQHLRWNASCNNHLFLKQSAALYATYYNIQIFIHRPFIPSPRHRTPVAFPSLAICTNAARSCCHVLESYSRLSHLPLPHLQTIAFTSAVILLLNIWSGKRTGFAPNPKREMQDVQRCMNMLKSCEKRWCSAGRYWDVLKDLAYAGDVSITDESPPNENKKKRRRTISNDSTHSLPSSPSVRSPTTQASSRCSRSQMSSFSPTSPTSPTSPLQAEPSLHFTLPVYSAELGRLPVYGQFNFLDTVGDSQITSTQFQAVFRSYPDSPVLPLQQPQVAIQSTRQPPFPNAQDGFPSVNALALGARSDNQSGSIYPRTSCVDEVILADSLMNPPHENGFQGGLRNGIAAEMTLPLLDNDTMTMWSSAPTNFELDEWNTYISNVNQMTHGLTEEYSSDDRSNAAPI